MVKNSTVKEFMENKSIQGLSAWEVQFSDNGQWVKMAELSVHKQRYYDSLYCRLQDELVTDKEDYTFVNVTKHPHKQGIVYRVNEHYDTDQSRIVGVFQEVE